MGEGGWREARGGRWGGGVGGLWTGVAYLLRANPTTAFFCYRIANRPYFFHSLIPTQEKGSSKISWFAIVRLFDSRAILFCPPNLP